MAVNIELQMIQAIANEYQSGRTVEEISIDSGIGKNNVKRALCEANLMSLTWYKTEEECNILKHLESLGITTLQELKDAITLWKNSLVI